MSVVLITGSAGLIGSEATYFFAQQGFEVVGIDNNMRQVFFGADASTEWNRKKIENLLGIKYSHIDVDIRDIESINRTFKHYGDNIKLVIHTAAQPSHDWAANDILVNEKEKSIYINTMFYPNEIDQISIK